MTDVEVSATAGTGLIEFVGGILMAPAGSGTSFWYLNWILTAIALVIIVGFFAGAAQGVRRHPAHFSGARENHRGGYRASNRIAGRRASQLRAYHAEAREEGSFRRGRSSAY